MLLWIILALIVVGVSFILAIRSMNDYREAPPASVSYSLFLVGNPGGLTTNVIHELHQAVIKDKFTLSFERLFKGLKRALVIFGPAEVLLPFKEALGLTEIEDYSNKVSEYMRAWEVGKKQKGEPAVNLSILGYIPGLLETEEFWWQIVTKPEKDSFRSTIRAVFKTDRQERLTSLSEELSRIGKGEGLAQIPEAYSSGQVVKFYRERSLPLGFSSDITSVNLTFPEINSLLGIQPASSSS